MDRDKDFLVWYGLEFLKVESFELISEWSFGIGTSFTWNIEM